MSAIALNYQNTLVISDNQDVQFNNNLCYRYLLSNNDLADTTIQGYRVCINNFISWLKSNDINQPTRETIKTYKLYLKNTNYSVGTKNQYIRAIKHLFKWLSVEGLYPNIADGIKGFRDSTIHKKSAFTENEFNKIVSDIDTTTIQGKRDLAIIMLMFEVGLRINEVHLMDIQDIEVRDNKYFVSIQGKGYTEKNIQRQFTKYTYKLIKDYLDSRDVKSGKDPLFVSTSNRALNKRITKQTLSQILKNRFRDSGYDSNKLTAHSIRHLTANEGIKAKKSIYEIQQHLRHQDPKTTEIYFDEFEDNNSSFVYDIHNQMFNKQKANIIDEIKDSLNDLQDDELSSVLDYIKEIRGGVESDK